MRRKNVKITLIAFGLLSLVGLWFLGKAWRTFVVEDSIHGTFYPVVIAIHKYKEDKGHPPAKLEDLCPDYLAEIPESKHISSTSLIVVFNDHWRLLLVSESLKKKRHYIAEDGLPLTEYEKKTLVSRYHDIWSVLEP